jgi:hypothetical protein
LFGGLFLLPDNFNAEKVINAYKSFQKAGPEIFIPAPPLHEEFSHQDHPDRNRLLEKINNEFNILEKPIEVNKKTDYEAGINEPPNPVIDEIQSESKPRKLELGSDMGADTDSVSKTSPPRKHRECKSLIVSFLPFSFQSVRQKRDKIKEVSATSSLSIIAVFVITTYIRPTVDSKKSYK